MYLFDPPPALNAVTDASEFGRCQTNAIMILAVRAVGRSDGLATAVTNARHIPGSGLILTTGIPAALSFSSALSVERTHFIVGAGSHQSRRLPAVAPCNVPRPATAYYAVSRKRRRQQRGSIFEPNGSLIEFRQHMQPSIEVG